MNKIFTQNHGLYGIYGFHGVRLTITLLLTALMAVSNVTAQEKKVTIHGNVFGGGNEAPVGGSVTVNMTGGTVNGDVYGGGAKANTNTDNWDGSTFSQSYHKVTIKAGESVAGYYTDEAGTTPATGTAVDGTDYYKKNETIVNLSGGEVKRISMVAVWVMMTPITQRISLPMSMVMSR